MDTFQHSSITISLDMVADISSYSTFRILYKKPDGVRGFWAGTRSGTIVSAAATPDVVGRWYVQAFATGAPGSLPGEYVEMHVHRQLNYTTVAPTTPVP